MCTVVFLVLRRRQCAVFDVIVDHGRRNGRFAFGIERAQIFFDESDDLIHIELKLGKLVPTGEVKIGDCVT
jgi:hypothetical protein